MTLPAEYTAILEQLTGPMRGSENRLFENRILALMHDGKLRFATDHDRGDGDLELAVLRREDTDYSISAREDRDFWINRRLVKSASLRDGDMIEFGENGPMVRYHRFSGTLPLRWTVAEIASDSVAYLRFSRKPLPYRIRHAAHQFAGRMLWQTTLVYRVTVVIAILALAGLALSQYRTSQLMRERVDASTDQLDAVATSLAISRQEALKPTDLIELRRELSTIVTSNSERLAELEQHSDAVKRVIRENTGAVAFLQLEYKLREVVSGKEMRHVVNSQGVPLMLPQGRPLLSLDGNGPIATIQLTGTGFLLTGGIHMATNRHVAMPWEQGNFSGAISSDLLEPVVNRFTAYFPNNRAPVSLSLLKASETADIAILRLDAPLSDLTGLKLARNPPVPGAEVILLGYPTGLRSLLAQSGHDFIEQLQADKELDFWKVSQRLSEAGLIMPLASRGIVAQVATEALVYDAETTVGGSGGPVLNLAGEVTAINTAILPEFGGSNIGVPTEKLADLIISQTLNADFERQNR